MTQDQIDAFSSAVGGHPPGDVLNMISSIFLVLLFIWAAWLVVRAMTSLYRGMNNDLIGLDLLWIGLRASALIAVATWLVAT